MPVPTNPETSSPNEITLDVHGTLPSAVSGRLTGVGPDAVVHSVHLHEGEVTYAARRIRSDTVVRDLVAFDASILACGEDGSAHELSTEGDGLRRVDLAGHGRPLTACPTYDPITGELHLVARDADGSPSHVVVAAGALTRRSRPIVDAPREIRSLGLGEDHLVFVADGVVGVAPRDGAARTTWIVTDTAAPRPVHVHQVGADVVLYALTPSLERWSLRPDRSLVERGVVDPRARRFARSWPDRVPRFVWTTGDDTISRHDVVTGRTVHLGLSPHALGDFVLIPDPGRPDVADGGWFVGVVNDPSGVTDLRVIDSNDLAAPAVATIRLPRPVSPALRCEWLPCAP